MGGSESKTEECGQQLACTSSQTCKSAPKNQASLNSLQKWVNEQSNIEEGVRENIKSDLSSCINDSVDTQLATRTLISETSKVTKSCKYFLWFSWDKTTSTAVDDLFFNFSLWSCVSEGSNSKILFNCASNTTKIANANKSDKKAFKEKARATIDECFQLSSIRFENVDEIKRKALADADSKITNTDYA